ncbi:amino acid ABC transporter permease [Myxococcus sp. MISCRS1]|nr:amino acid ABC transporter permease [Myxococcus sp. MISCRS1]MCY1001869.1 amino acid ABC transporter permease [Myxococcus sp. MISCRS1]
MVEWTDAQTREVLSQTSTAKLGWGQGLMFLQAALVTLVVSVGAMALAVPLGVGLALVRLYGPRWLSGMASFYVEVFRGTPVLLQLYVLYYGLAGVLRLDALSAAVLGLGLNYAAYEAEVYRAGVLAVPRGQMEAALALGMSTPLALRRVVFPQAFRVALPSVTNDFIALLKDSSLVSVISVVELTKRMTITAVDVRSWLLPGALCAALYLAMSYPLSLLARRLEARLARG